MSFLEFINREKDFLYLIDLLDLVNVNLDSSIKDNIVYGKRHNIPLSSFPVKDRYRDHYLPIFKDCVLYKEASYSSEHSIFIIDRYSKSIILFESLEYELYKTRLKEFKDYHDGFNYLKKNLNEYKIYVYNDLKKEVSDFMNEEINNLIKTNYDYLYLNGKKRINNLEEFETKTINELKTLYIKNQTIEDEWPSYIFENRSIFYNFSDRAQYFAVMYLRSKTYYKSLIKQEFYKALNNKEQYFNATETANERFYITERTKELNKIHYSEFVKDSKLNRYKKIYEATKLAGKTININGEKYENCVYGYTNNIDNMYVGRYSKEIYFKDIEKITFGRSILFDMPLEKEYINN